MSRALSKNFIVHILSFIFLFIFIPYNACSKDRVLKIDEVKISGLNLIDPQSIEEKLQIKKGDKFNLKELDEKIKELYRARNLKSIVIKKRIKKNNKVNLEFILKENPIISSMEIEGNDEIDKEEIKETLGFDVNHFYTSFKEHQGIKKLYSLYEKKGFSETKIEIERIEEDEDKIKLFLDIKEGKEQIIRKVLFKGNLNVESSILRDEILTKRYKWWASWILGTGVLNKDNFKNDIILIKQYYMNHGYIDIRVFEPEIIKIEYGVNLLFKVKEGSQYRVGKLSASGDLIKNSEKKTLKGIKSREGEIFSAENLRDDAFIISDKFTDIGYAFVNVDRLTNVNPSELTVDIDFSIDKGDLTYVSFINISGNKKTKDNVIRRSLKISPGELYSSSKIKRSEILLKRLRYFEEVSVSKTPSKEKDSVDLDVSLREGQTGFFRIGGGVSSGDGFMFITRLTERNLLGTGNLLSLDLSTGTNDENFMVSFKNPRVSDSFWSFETNLMSLEREFEDFDRKQSGGSVRVGYPLWFLDEEIFDDVRLSLSYSLLKVKISNIKEDASQFVINSKGETLSSSITSHIVRNTINNPLDATSGSFQSFSLELAGLGGDEKFWLLNLKNSVYFSLFEFSSGGELVFCNRVHLGWGKTFDDKPFPLFKRFFSGGINSVRGFDSRELGPKDENLHEYGGNKELISNFELIVPLIHSAGLKGVIFYDIGNAFTDDVDIEFKDLRQAVGWGFRWRSPIAPLRIEFGYPLDKERGDKSVVTHFSFETPL